MKACCCTYDYYRPQSPCGCCPGRTALVVNFAFYEKELWTNCNPPNPGPCNQLMLVDFTSLSGAYVLYPEENFVQPECPNGWRMPPDREFPSQFFVRKKVRLNGRNSGLGGAGCTACVAEIPVRVVVICGSSSTVDSFQVLMTIGQPFDDSICGAIHAPQLAAWQHLESPRKTCLPATIDLKRAHWVCPGKEVKAKVSINW